VDISEALEAAMEAVEVPVPEEAEEQSQEVLEVPPVEAPAEEPAAEEPAAEVAEEEPEEAPLPPGVVVVPAVEGELATQFTISDEEGEIEVPNLMIEYKANGQVRKDRLDQVVKLAQWGVYNEEREQKTKQVEQEAVTYRQTAEELEALIAERENQIERLLQDDDFLYTVREAYERENSPDKRAERAERQFEEYKVQQEMQQITQKGEQFWTSEIEPALDMIVKALPTVSFDELAERFTYAMQAHMDRAPNGQPYIPMSRYDQVRKYMVEDLAIWAQIQHARRAEPTTKQPAKPSVASDQLTKARIEAQKAKRQVGQATRPVGKAGQVNAAPKQSKPSTIDEALESAMANVLSAI
jgi:hypothetical protein